MAARQAGGPTLAKSFEKLSRPENYETWLRAFKGLARVEGVLGIYTGKDHILPKPTRPSLASIKEKRKTRAQRRTADAEIISQGQSSIQTGTQRDYDDERAEAKQARDDYELELSDYSVDLQVYFENEKRVRHAIGLLEAAVQPWVYKELDSDPDDPRVAWVALEEANKHTSDKCRDFAITKLDELTLKDPTNIRDYVFRSEELYDDISEAGGGFARSQLIFYMIRGLPRQYSYYIKNWRINNANANITDKAYKHFRIGLLQYAEDTKAEWAAQNKGKGKANSSMQKYNKGGRKKKRPCCHWCQILGHVEKDCRKKASGQPKVESKDAYGSKDSQDSNDSKDPKDTDIDEEIAPSLDDGILDDDLLQLDDDDNLNDGILDQDLLQYAVSAFYIQHDKIIVDDRLDGDILDSMTDDLDLNLDGNYIT